MPRLPSGQMVDITSGRARYHATRLNIRVTRNTPHQELYRLVDIVYVEEGESGRGKGYRFTGYTLSDIQWLNKWKRNDREAFLSWLKERGAIQEIEGARNKVIYDSLPHQVRTYPYPQRLYSILKRRVSAIAMRSAGADQWRNTLLNMRHCGVREEELVWSGVLAFLESEESGKRQITREELLSRIDYGHIRMELTNDMISETPQGLPFQEFASLIRRGDRRYPELDLKQGDYAVLRYRDSLLGYGIISLHSAGRYGDMSRRWITVDPYGHRLSFSKSLISSEHERLEGALAEAAVHAAQHYGLHLGLTASGKYEYLSLDGGEDYREWILTLPDYSHSHFTPHFTERNVLLHIRTNQRTDIQGRKLLFIEEIQSDWHQQSQRDPASGVRRPKPPEAPFRKEWLLLALKMMLQHAQAVGCQALSWTPGAIQQQRYHRRVETIMRLYDRSIPDHLLRLSRHWGGEVQPTHIATRDPWLSLRRAGDHWYVRDESGKFVTAKKYTRKQGMALSRRHSRLIQLEVPMFVIPPAMGKRIADDALPLFGELAVDPIEKPLCGSAGFRVCDEETRILCKGGC